MKLINNKSFQQIKSIANILDQAKKLDNEGCELDDLPGKLNNLVKSRLKNYDEDDLGELMANNLYLIESANLNIFLGDGEELAYLSNKNTADLDDEPLNYSELSNRINELVHLGKNGIMSLIKRDNKLLDKIHKLQNEMNVIG